MIYCMEAIDQPNGVALADVSLTLDSKSRGEFQSEYKPDLLDGIVVLHHRGGVLETDRLGEVADAEEPDENADDQEVQRMRTGRQSDEVPERRAPGRERERAEGIHDGGREERAPEPARDHLHAKTGCSK